MLIWQIATAACLLILILIWLYWRTRKLHILLELEQQKRQQAILMLQDQIHEINRGSLGLGQALASFQHKQQMVGEKVEELQSQDPSARLYQQAAELVKKGASVEELVEQCELPPAEAELLINLHRQS
jgi:hypothetical protein